MRRIELTGGSAPMAVNGYAAFDPATTANLTVVPGAAGKYTSLHGFMLSVDLAGTYSFTIGGETVWKAVVTSAGAYISDIFDPWYLEGDAQNAALVLTKPSGAQAAVTCFVGQA